MLTATYLEAMTALTAFYLWGECADSRAPKDQRCIPQRYPVRSSRLLKMLTAT